jgi:hypothetical protein
MRLLAATASAIYAMYMPFCTANVQSTMAPVEAQRHMVELWQPPRPGADMLNGPWGAEHAPDPKALYTFEKPKTHGVSPGMTVVDPSGERWSVKQGEEGPVEVTLSRILSAIGYHQPPVYYLPAFRFDHGDWIELAAGGRFRPHIKAYKEVGDWSWQENPFVGTRQYQGLIVALLVFNSSDLKNSNNSLYRLPEAREGSTRWFVVRDIGTALGETGRVDPDPQLTRSFRTDSFRHRRPQRACRVRLSRLAPGNHPGPDIGGRRPLGVWPARRLVP